MLSEVGTPLAPQYSRDGGSCRLIVNQKVGQGFFQTCSSPYLFVKIQRETHASDLFLIRVLSPFHRNGLGLQPWYLMSVKG